jgi:predicted DNA-binding protein
MDIQRNNSKLSIMLNTEQNLELNKIAEHLGISKSILVRLLLAKSISELKRIGLTNLEFKLEQISSKNK